MDLEGKVVIVTGGAGNIGSGCAREVARQGAKVVVSDLATSRVHEIVSEICASGGIARAHEGDVSCEDDVVSMIETAKTNFGGLDCLANVAAAMHLIPQDRDMETMTTDVWDRMMAVNLRGAMLGCKHSIPLLRERGGGSIIHFGSTAGILGDIGLFAYSTTKAGLEGFTRTIATTFGKEGIRCNTICPGSVMDDTARSRMPEKMLELFERTRSTPRLGRSDDIAHMAVFLASDKSTYVTGQSFVVDGGGTAHQPWVRVL